MDQEKKENKKTGRWVRALAILLLIAVGGGWLLWGKDLNKQPATKAEDVNKLSPQPQVAKELPASGGDEELLAEAEKVDTQVADTVGAKAKQPGKMIEYKKRVIREFKWNEGVDSLHNDGDVDTQLGPYGILVNKQGFIYIFDLDSGNEGWGGGKLYDPNGKLLKTSHAGGEPLGIDDNGNIFLNGMIYDADLNFIKNYHSPAVIEGYQQKYISLDGRLYLLKDDANKAGIYNIWRCFPLSDESMIDDIVMKYNPGKAPWMVIPCNIVEEAMAPNYLVLAKQLAEKGLVNLGSYSFSEDILINQLSILSNLKIEFLEILSMDSIGNLYFGYIAYDQNEPYWKSRRPFMAVVGKKGNLISSIALCNTSTFFTEIYGMYCYIYVEPHSGKIYQLCAEDDIPPNLTVWEIGKEGKN